MPCEILPHGTSGDIQHSPGSTASVVPRLVRQHGSRTMITITFLDRETEKRALAFLIGRFSGRVLRSGEHLVPEAALEALADQNIPFTAATASGSPDGRTMKRTY